MPCVHVRCSQGLQLTIGRSRSRSVRPAIRQKMPRHDVPGRKLRVPKVCWNRLLSYSFAGRSRDLDLPQVRPQKHARLCARAPCTVKRAPAFNILKKKGGSVKLSITRCIWIYMPHDDHVEVHEHTFNPGTSWLRPILPFGTHMLGRTSPCENSL